MEKEIMYRHNIMSINSLDTFFSVKGGFSQGRRDVYFIRAVGCSGNMEEEILAIDRRMGMEMNRKRLFYTRASSLPLMSSGEAMRYYEEQFVRYKKEQKLSLKHTEKNDRFERTLGRACRETTEKYRLIKANMTESIEKNFVVKLLYWTDCILGKALSDWDERKCYKILADNVFKEQEYLFYYMLTLIGCDVLLLERSRDIATADAIMSLSKELRLGGFSSLPLPEYKVFEEKSLSEPEVISKTVLRPRPAPSVRAEASGGTEKSFEELALLASSIVMIEVHDRMGKAVGTGSGVMIGRNGYILTNHHVTRGGFSFCVRIEGDDAIYNTNEIIKYNSVFDLSVLRINRTLTPLPVYNGKKKLARGQKVVAIGSPLGLFNSVSDGIISGFREIDSVDMIQFTAPISHGSSGGAVLNMQGEVIGISTAGFDSGQNINLAVSYESINLFVGGIAG